MFQLVGKVNVSFEHLKKKFYRYESNEQVEENWTKYRVEATESFKKKSRQAIRTVKKMKRMGKRI